MPVSGFCPRRAPRGADRFGWLIFKFLISLCFVLLIGACSRPATPELLRVERVGPGLIEGGVDLRIEGSGFPEGREADIVLSGVLYAPGREPEKTRLQLRGSSRSSALILAPLGESRLLGLTQGAGHATFRGKVRVAFQPQRSGAPPLLGQSEKVVVDFVPRMSKSDAAAIRFAGFLGLTLGGQLAVEGIEPGSEAELAGLELGDRIVELDSVRLLSFAEFVPAPRGTFSRLMIQRAGYDGPSEVTVARRGFLATDPLVALRAVLASFAICLGLLLLAHPPRFLQWVFLPKPAIQRPSFVERTPALVGAALAGLALFWGLLRLSPKLDLDLVVVTSVGTIALLISGFLQGGRSRNSGAGFGLVGALSGALSAAFYLIPYLVAVLLGAANAGSLRLIDAQRAQDFGPAGWLLFRSPWTLLLGLLALGALIPRAGRRPPCAGVGVGAEGWGIAAGLEQVGALLLVGLWVILFLGGAAGVDPQGSHALLLLGVKVVPLSLVLDWTRTRALELRRAEGWKLLGWGLLVWSLVAASTAALVHMLSEVTQYEEVLRSFSLWLGMGVLVLLPIVGLRALSHRGRRTDPWI